ncbi:hypothetical protein ACIBXA_07485 [Micromonospora echinaurantiaca]|uniref:hypothetical protein n=1 Tax=Micromonospora echinaurantiaca TaxID=47857 RepID=UPI0037A21E3C
MDFVQPIYRLTAQLRQQGLEGGVGGTDLNVCLGVTIFLAFVVVVQKQVRWVVPDIQATHGALNGQKPCLVVVQLQEALDVQPDAGLPGSSHPHRCRGQCVELGTDDRLLGGDLGPNACVIADGSVKKRLQRIRELSGLGL